MLASQRKAWNEAMRSAGASIGRPSSARRSDRQKKRTRREKARKSLDQFESSTEQKEYRAAVRIDALEDVVEPADTSLEEEEYDEDEAEYSGKRRRGATKRAAKSKASAGAAPKRLKSRNLASILMEDAGKPHGTTKKYLAAEARPLPGQPSYPPRKFCPVTGLFGTYTDPKSGVPYAALSSLEQIRERVPPWMSLSGATAYSEAIKSLRNED